MKHKLDFSKCNILIVGDIILDKYYFGQVDRISPEAPVPVVNIKKEESRLGGASNVANNICSLGGTVGLFGAIGHDFFGKEIERMTRNRHITAYFAKTLSPTITKARIIGGKQQLVRLDYEENFSLSEEEEQQIRKNIIASLKNYNVLVISDYSKGFISDDFCQYLIREARQQQLPVLIDPKGKNWDKYIGADIITPNVKELSDISGYTVANEDLAIEQAAHHLLLEKHLKSLLITRSEKGMSLITADQSIHIPTHSEEVFDVSGAGDTVVAALSCCIAAGMDISNAMKIANTAAGIVVKKLGTATLTIEELNNCL